MNPWALLTTTAGLIAFNIGLFTLVGRERKSPYIINSVFPIFLLCLVAAVSALCSTLVPIGWHDHFLQFSGWTLAAAFLFSIYRVYRIAVRFVYFVDAVSPKHLPPLRQIRRWWTFRGPRPNYAHNTVSVPKSLEDKITAILSNGTGTSRAVRENLELKSLAIAVKHQGQGNDLLTEIAVAFLESGYSVQYLTASRHPIEFIEFLKKKIEQKEKEWKIYTKQIVVVDAYSPHFAFADSIYSVKTRELESLDITCVNSKVTYAGMHSASSRAFKQIRRQLGKDRPRQPTLVIYEDSHALTDLESTEQYRIFIRHVLPSERMWDGMFTVFIEAALPEPEWNLLDAYTSITLDLRDKQTVARKKRTKATSDSGE